MSPPPQPAAPPAPPRPAYQNLRYEEDWSTLHRPEPRDPFDALKAIELRDDPPVLLTLGGDYRVRLESWDGFLFGQPPGQDASDTFVLNRIKLHADLRIGDFFRAFAEGKSALSTGRDLLGGRRTIDADELDLQNAFIDLRFRPADRVTLTLRPGRQELQFGKQRLVSPLDWANARRTFEGFRGILEAGGWRIDGFITRLVPVQKFEFNDGDSGQDLYGIYATRRIAGKALDWDLYWLGLDRQTAAFGGITGEENRHTFGSRLGGPIGASGFDFDLEAALQVGDHAGRDIFAFMATAEAGYTFAGAPWSPRIDAGIDFASGDDDPADGDVETFNQLFPLGHAFLGFIDAVGRQNIVDLRAGVAVKPVPSVTIRVDGHIFFRASDRDALYDAAGAVVRPGLDGGSSEVGQEIDVTLRWQIDPHAAILLGYSHFFPGAFIEETGPSDPINFAYASFEFKF